MTQSSWHCAHPLTHIIEDALFHVQLMPLVLEKRLTGSFAHPKNLSNHKAVFVGLSGFQLGPDIQYKSLSFLLFLAVVPLITVHQVDSSSFYQMDRRIFFSQTKTNDLLP